MKLTLIQALALLKASGISNVEVVENEADSDYTTTKDNTDPDKVINQDAAIRMIDASRGPIILQKELPGKETEINSRVAGKINNALRSQLHELTGIPKTELEGKDSKEAAALAFAHWSKTSGGDKEAFAAQLKDVMDAHAKEKETILATEGGKYKELENKYTRKTTVDGLLNIYNSAKGINPKANKQILAEDFLSDLEKRAIVKYNEATKEFELYDKANPATRLLDASKNSFLKIDAEIKNYHSARDQWREDTRDEKATDHMKGKDQDYKAVEKDGKVIGPRDQRLAALEAYVNEDPVTA